MAHDIALVDDHHLMRAGLVSMVNALRGFHVALEAANGKELIELLKDRDPPAIAIVDLNMPVMDGYATIAWLRENSPTILPLALTFDATEEAMVRAVRAGARGFVLKTARPHVLKNALDSLLRTGYFYTEESNELLSRNPEMKTREERERDEILSSLTDRETEFLLLVCSEEEYTYEEISRLMNVHRRTVDNYRIAIFEKFKVKSKTGLVLFALRWGLVN